ncbi:MAG: hypothetical protein ACJAWH_001512 [Maribacter sp.]|jgi:hypothetical protein
MTVEKQGGKLYDIFRNCIMVRSCNFAPTKTDHVKGNTQTILLFSGHYSSA